MPMVPHVRFCWHETVINILFVFMDYYYIVKYLLKYKTKQLCSLSIMKHDMQWRRPYYINQSKYNYVIIWCILLQVFNEFENSYNNN